MVAAQLNLSSQPVQPNLSSYRSGHLRAMAAIILLAAGAGVDGLSALLQAFKAGGVLGGPLAAGSGEETLSVIDLLHACVLLLNFLVYVGSIIAFLMWLHRAYRNLRPLGAPSTQYTPGWAVGYFFIPFANLVRPYQAVREVWRWSKPAQDVAGLSFTADTGASLVGWWWACWIVSNVMSNVYWRLSDEEGAAGAEPWVGLCADLASIVAAAVAIFMIRAIDNMQTERSRQLALSTTTFEQPPPPPTFPTPAQNFG